MIEADDCGAAARNRRSQGDGGSRNVSSDSVRRKGGKKIGDTTGVNKGGSTKLLRSA